MGKTTDKLYVTQRERTDSANTSRVDAQRQRQQGVLPFWTCGISQQPISEGSGVVDRQGHVFDLQNLMPYVRKHKVDPVTREAVERVNYGDNFTKLKIHKNGEDMYADPVTLKPFQRLSDAVVIWPTGNVFFRETIQESNIKPNVWRDLVTEDKFAKDDVIKLIGGAGVGSTTPATNQPVKRKRDTTNEEEEEEEDGQPKSRVTTHHVAASLTSTAVEPHVESKFENVPTEELLVPKKFTKLGYATIKTRLGDMTLELNPKFAPKAVYNFIKLAQQGYYDGLLFHRSIKHFMVQTGDPTGTGSGGQSVFGHNFKDETNSPVNKHEGRGVVSMANRGKNTNGSQFFITYRSCTHLDTKHTVFGKVVEGLDVLDRIEVLEVDKKERPVSPVKMDQVVVKQDPFEDGLWAKPQQSSQQVTEQSDAPYLKQSGDEGPDQVAAGLQRRQFTTPPPSLAARKKHPGKLVSIQDSDMAAW